MGVRFNEDGSISVGILDDFAVHMNPPVIEDAPEEKTVEEEKPKKTPTRAKKTAKK